MNEQFVCVVIKIWYVPQIHMRLPFLSLLLYNSLWLSKILTHTHMHTWKRCWLKFHNINFCIWNSNKMKFSQPTRYEMFFKIEKENRHMVHRRKFSPCLCFIYLMSTLEICLCVWVIFLRCFCQQDDCTYTQHTTDTLAQSQSVSVILN